ncbi:MAG: hypothetical protein L0154_13300 [Chloroflexi bacterium]|nr:hypothetical protein [Chloroflexota bacterium]
MKVMPIQVLDEGVLIPRIYLHNAGEVEVVVTADYILVKPKAAIAANEQSNGGSIQDAAVAPSKQEQTLAVPRAGIPVQAELSSQEQQQRIAALKASPTWSDMSEREQAIAVLRAGGMLTELSPEEQQRAASSTVTLEEVIETLSSVEGQSLSELIIEMRGPKG